MPARGRRDAGDRESSGEHRRSSQSTLSQNSPSAVVEPRLADLRNRLAALRNRTSRNRLAAADSCTSTAVELNQRQEIGELDDYCERYLQKITAPELRYQARILARNLVRNAKEQMEVDSVDSVSSSEEEEEDEEEEEEEVDVVN